MRHCLRWGEAVSFAAMRTEQLRVLNRTQQLLEAAAIALLAYLTVVFVSL